MMDKASVVDEECWSSVGDLLGHPEPDALVSLDQFYQLIPEQLVEHRVETFQLWQSEQVPLQFVVKVGTGLQSKTLENGFKSRVEERSGRK